MKLGKGLKLVIVGVVAVLLVDLYLLSSWVIRKSGNWIDNGEVVIEETEVETETETERKPDILLKEGTRLYKNKGEKDIKLWGEAKEKYERVCYQIVNLSDDLFKGLEEAGESNDDKTNICYYRTIDDDTLGLSDEKFPEEGYAGFFIENSLKIIGLYNGTTAIAVYNYDSGNSKELVVIDFSNSHMREDGDDIYSVGMTISASGMRGEFKVMHILDYDVLFLRRF